jgi:gamma-polyglutamate biosynthesis protein CapA
MTEIELPHEPADVGWRGRLHRRLRAQRTVASRHAVIGALVCVAVLFADGAIGSDIRAGERVRQATAGTPVDDEEVRFSAAMVGDLMFGRHVERVIERRGSHAPLAEVEHLLEGDYVSGNLEQVLSDNDDLPEADKLIHLQSGSETAQMLADAGFTTMSLANNHTMDHGIPGLRDTIAALEDAGIRHAGAGEDLDAAMEIDLQEHGDLTVATLSFTDVFVQGFIARAFQGGALEADPDLFVPMIRQARAEADLVIVHFHWGEEYDLRVRADQREMAEWASWAGADIIVGHHPHVLMPVERIGDTLVFYSLGNFVFDQGWSRTRESVVARYLLQDDGTARIELVPVFIREATPRELPGPSGTYRRERIFQQVSGDGFEWRREDGRLVTEIDHSHVLEGARP